MFVCPICNNSDEKYIGYKNGEPYCRRCISFIKDDNLNQNLNLVKSSDYYIKYPLTKEQDEISNSIVKNFINKKNTLVYAVCGAGKTELVYEVIRHALLHNMKIGFAIPRKDVVSELAVRLSIAFKDNKVVSVYGGHTSILEGEILVLTTHQLCRYNSYFDLLILDEIDAFPYKDNEVLYNFFKRSVKGNYVLMSATPSTKFLEEFKNNEGIILSLFVRYHHKPLPVPTIIKKHFFFKYDYLISKLKEYKKEGKRCFVFTPTIEVCEEVYSIIKNKVTGGQRVHSKCNDREEIINDFRKEKYFFLVTTAVLERGVTVKDLQVIIFNADHEIYNEASLIQISGRSGRVISSPYGEVIFLCDKETIEMKKAILKIKEANSHLYDYK